MHRANLQRNAHGANAAQKQGHPVTAPFSGTGCAAPGGTQQHSAHQLLACMLGVAVSLILSIPPVFAEGNPPVAPGPAATVSQPSAQKLPVLPAGASGIVIHIDPQTGAIVKKPAPGSVPLRLTPQLLNAFSTSHEGLVAVSSAVPGGGVKVDLQGRFQSSLIATIDAKGQLRMQHLDGLTPSRDTP